MAKTNITIDITVTHNGTVDMAELVDMFQMEIEQHNQALKDNPDDFGVMEYKVDSISYGDVNVTTQVSD